MTAILLTLRKPFRFCRQQGTIIHWVDSEDEGSSIRARSVRKALDIEVALSYAGNQLKRPLSRKRLDLAQAFGSYCYYTLKHTKFYGLDLLSSSMLPFH